MNRRSKRKTRQLALTERGQRLPLWSALPDEVRREVVALLAKLMQSEQCEVVADEESGDE